MRNNKTKNKKIGENENELWIIVWWGWEWRQGGRHKWIVHVSFHIIWLVFCDMKQVCIFLVHFWDLYSFCSSSVIATSKLWVEYFILYIYPPPYSLVIYAQVIILVLFLPMYSLLVSRYMVSYLQGLYSRCHHDLRNQTNVMHYVQLPRFS